jgi:GNAT superfamily N-acetyltransferase
VPEPSLRPLQAHDVDAVHRVSVDAFDDLQRRLGGPPEPPGAITIAAARVRIGRLLATDPGGAWVAERGGEIVGCSMSIVRDGLWGLSLLVVRPDAQSSGVGRELLARAHDYGNGARGRIVLASRDPRALRSYARLGLHLHPALCARGRPSGIAAPAGIRPGTLEDLPLTVDVDHAVRGAPHGDDIAALLDAGCELLILPDRGYAMVREGGVRLLAARDEEAAAALLQACLASAGGREAVVEWITSAQPWAVEPCLAAGLELRSEGGAVFLGGDVGPFAPYLPNGAYL